MSRRFDEPDTDADWNDACPVGDPDCDAPDDGEWRCHDACTPHPAGVPDHGWLTTVFAAIRAAGRRWDNEHRPAETPPG